jgi:hypothetical protein
MRHLGTLAVTVGILVLAAPHARSESKLTLADERSSAIVIILKDGQQRSFPMSEVERIEFATPSTHASAGQGRFLGKWRVGDGMGGHFYITLERDGMARKTMASPHGRWEVVDGEAQVTWEDGWRDAIRKAGSRYEKAAYSPGTTFADQPNHVASAESVDRNPI